MREHGKPIVNKLLDHLEARLNGPLDGREIDNRRACWSLILRVTKENEGRRQQGQPVYDAETSIIALIDAIFSGHPSMSFHVKNCTSFRYLLNHGRRIVNEYRQARASDPRAKMDELASRFAGGTRS